MIHSGLLCITFVAECWNVLLMPLLFCHSGLHHYSEKRFFIAQIANLKKPVSVALEMNYRILSRKCVLTA